MTSITLPRGPQREATLNALAFNRIYSDFWLTGKLELTDAKAQIIADWLDDRWVNSPTMSVRDRNAAAKVIKAIRAAIS